MDCLGLPRMQMNPIFVMVDCISQMMHFICSKKTSAVIYVANLCFTEGICIHKMTKTTTTDRDPNPMFISPFFEGLVEEV